MDVMQEASNVLEQLMADVRGKFAHTQHQQGVLDSLKAFTAAVDWKVILLTRSTWSLVTHVSSHAFSVQEPWLIAVLTLQTFMFFSILVFRQNTSYLTSIFALASKPTNCYISTLVCVTWTACPAVVLVYTSEHLNRALGQHWQSFANQPYFDRNGIFISAVLSAPLVLDMLVILVCCQRLFLHWVSESSITSCVAEILGCYRCAIC